MREEHCAEPHPAQVTTAPDPARSTGVTIPGHLGAFHVLTLVRANPGRRLLEQLSRPACAFLGSRTAILGGAMSQVSKARLVAAISRAGGFGVLAAGGRRPTSI